MRDAFQKATPLIAIIRLRVVHGFGLRVATRGEVARATGASKPTKITKHAGGGSHGEGRSDVVRQSRPTLLDPLQTPLHDSLR